MEFQPCHGFAEIYRLGQLVPLRYQYTETLFRSGGFEACMGSADYLRPGGGKVHGVLVHAAWRWSRCHILCLCQCGVYGFGGEPKPLFLPENGKSCIDGDIVYKDGVFHLFYKTEGHGNGIKVATTRSLTSGAWTEEPDYKQQTKEAVEGAGTFKLIGQDKYILMYDVYMKGSYQFTETTDLKNFKVIDSEVKMNFHPRHGTIIPITRHELLRITDEWGKPTELGALPNNPVLPGFHADPEILYSHQTQKYYIYSTTDGQPGWGGWYFTVFSSTDLKTWQDEGVMLDLKSEQVPWADGNAWAPCIEEKKWTVSINTSSITVETPRMAAASRLEWLRAILRPALSPIWDALSLLLHPSVAGNRLMWMCLQTLFRANPIFTGATATWQVPS